MSMVVIVVVAAAAVSAFLYLTRSNKTCALCHHPTSAHKRTAKSGWGRHHFFCFRCNKECG